MKNVKVYISLIFHAHEKDAIHLKVVINEVDCCIAMIDRVELGGVDFSA